MSCLDENRTCDLQGAQWVPGDGVLHHGTRSLDSSGYGLRPRYAALARDEARRISFADSSSSARTSDRCDAPYDARQSAPRLTS